MEASLEKNYSQLICTVAQGSSELGYVVIDSTVGGRSCGGLRMLPDVDKSELCSLARSMTLKYGFLGLSQGGAKAGIRGNAKAPTEKRRQLLKAFGATVAPLLRSRAFVHGTECAPITPTSDYAPVVWCSTVKRRELRSTDSGYYTALTVIEKVKQAANHKRRNWVPTWSILIRSNGQQFYFKRTGGV